MLRTLFHPALLFCLVALSAAAFAEPAAPTAPVEPTVVERWCDNVGNRLRSVSGEDCRTQGFAAAPESTVKGNPLVYLDIEAANAKDEAPAKRVMVVGGIHGDELTAISIVFRWIESIRKGDGGDYHWRVIPLANPDGLLIRPSTRVNANGVDINRNFETPDWEKQAKKYWVKRTRRDPRRNPGETAGSEVETRWLQAQVEEFKPDLIVSIHAPYNLLDYDGPVTKPLRFGRLSLNRLGVYPGSMGNYFGLYKQIPVITIELPNAGIMPSQRDQTAIWEDMLKWMHEYIGETERHEDAPAN